MKRSCLLPAILLVTSCAFRAEGAVHSSVMVVANNQPNPFPNPQPFSVIAAVSVPAPGCGGNWAIWLSLEPEGALRIMSATLGAAHGWIQTEPGQSITPASFLGQTILGGPVRPFLDIHQPSDGAPYLFGYFVEREPFTYDPTPDDCIGWVRFRREGDELFLIDDAITISGGGIIAGTLIEVPEPGFPALCSPVALLTLLFRRRRNPPGSIPQAP